MMNVEYPTSNFEVGYSTFIILLPFVAALFAEFYPKIPGSG